MASAVPARKNSDLFALALPNTLFPLPHVAQGNELRWRITSTLSM